MDAAAVINGAGNVTMLSVCRQRLPQFGDMGAPVPKDWPRPGLMVGKVYPALSLGVFLTYHKLFWGLYGVRNLNSGLKKCA